MTTDEEKSNIAKLLQELKVPETKLSERCSDLIREFHKKFDSEIIEEEGLDRLEDTINENPYCVDRRLLEENERKLQELLSASNRVKQKPSDMVAMTEPDPKRPWRTHTNKEKLLRIDNELKRHFEKACHMIVPLDEGSGQCIPRPETRQCFLRSLGELRNLRVLAIEYSHLADGNGGALISLLPVIRRPHFRLQLICRENQTPGRADAALGVGGYGIPDTAWRRMSIACPDLYLLLAFFRIRDYDYIRRFLTPSIPLREVHIQFGIDIKMRQRQDSDISCFIRHIAFRYASSLTTLSIHQWRFAVFPLRRVFELMPRLRKFYYVGQVKDEVDLREMFHIVSCGVCDKLKQVNILIQDEESKQIYWRKVAVTLTNEFDGIMQLFDIKLCIDIYRN